MTSWHVFKSPPGYTLRYPENHFLIQSLKLSGFLNIRKTHIIVLQYYIFDNI